MNDVDFPEYNLVRKMRLIHFDGIGYFVIQEVSEVFEGMIPYKDVTLYSAEYMLNYKHITPNVNISFGDVRETADVNAVKDAIQKMMEDELAELYVVEEA